MTIADRWLLPDGMDEVLPPQASRMEELRRALLDLYHCWGYDQVMPPPVEFLDSLLTGTGTDLDLQTFKLTDQLTGRMMGASADVTPQVARMDAHSLKRQGPVRLCYCTNVLRAKADQHQGGRSPVQVGVELFGHAGLEADSEIIHLALASLHAAGADEIHLALGHIGIYRSLVEAAALSDEQERALFEALALKSPGQLAEQVNVSVSDPVLAEFSTATMSLAQANQLIAADERARYPAFIDEHGVETTDPTVMQRGGSMHFMGESQTGHKGYALSLWCEALVAMTGGSCNNPDAPARQSLFITVMDPECFTGRDRYFKEIKRFMGHLKSSRRRPGVEQIRLPGERSATLLREAERGGLSLDEDKLNRLGL